MTTKTRARRTRRPSPQNEARKAQVELAVTMIDDDAPDFWLFLQRWADRYGENNLRRLWVQAPRATVLHKFGTWRGMGRQVRDGEHAIWLKQPHTGFDPDKITAANPDGKVFYGAAWMALFDYAQTHAIGEFEDAAADADPDLLEEVRRLRAEAVKLHPDTTGRDSAPEFVAAWARYEAAKARL